MQNESKVGKFIVFQVGNYLLALPINEVLKVIDCSSMTNKELRTMGVVRLGHHTIRVLDLHQQLSASDFPQLADNQPFLVVTRDSQGELCGIPVQEPPNLVELPLEVMQSLPKSERQSGVLNLVSHAAVVSQNEATTTIFLVDLKRTPNPVVTEVAALPVSPS